MDVGDESAERSGSMDFWPIDPASEELQRNPLLQPDYTIIIGLNLYKVRASVNLRVASLPPRDRIAQLQRFLGV
jgi:hypothetical protein